VTGARGAAPTGIILAAGRGTRISPLSETVPKPLLPVCNRPIMSYHLDLFASMGIRNVIVVIGRHGDQIRDVFGDGRQLSLDIRYVVDEHPEGIASSLMVTERLCGDICVVILGDIFLPLPSLHRLLAPVTEQHAGGALLVARERDPAAISRNFAVELGDAGRITRVVEKPQQPKTDLKGCGFYVFRRSIFDAIRRTPRSALRNEYEITDAIQVLLDDGQELIAVDGETWDINITSPADLLDCNLRMLRLMKKQSIIADGARLPEGMSISMSVIGSDVVVDRPLRIDRSLILAGSHIIGSEESLVRAIVSSHATVLVGE
jgi:dTDP-glucose pyrophosphorylase